MTNKEKRQIKRDRKFFALKQKGWAIITQIDLPKCPHGTVLSIHTEEPVTTLSIFEVREIEFTIR